MATQYHVYKNDGAGGPVDYSTIVATVTSGTTYTGSALAASSDTTFAVRAFDSVSGLEEENVDCRVRIVLDSGRADITTRPNPPVGLSAHAKAGGKALVTWAYNPRGQGGAPTSFKVWLTAGTSVNYAASPATTVTYSAHTQSYRVTLSGLSDATAYVVGVRATNASGDETNATKVSIVGDTTGPNAVDSLTATAGF